MAYSELIKNYNKIRDYMRDFFVYGFRTRNDFDAKSARSYDNERRRVESWMGDFMQFRHDRQGKSVFLSVDARTVPHNPLYNAFKTKSFTDKDILLHFALMEIMSEDELLSIKEIADEAAYYFNGGVPDESTIRKKLKEYTELGIVESISEGNRKLYRKSRDEVELIAWEDAAQFFSEEDGIGVIGSFILDRLDAKADCFSFKHNYMLCTLESEIISDILECRRNHKIIEITYMSKRAKELHKKKIYPLRIYISTQNGKQYVVGYDYKRKRPGVFRLDFIGSVKPAETEDNPEALEKAYDSFSKSLWGVASGKAYARNLEHIEFTVSYADGERHIPRRLEREKRCGRIEYIDLNTCRYIADVYEAQELIPWVRTFIGRIEDFRCSNERVQETFYKDIAEMKRQYGGDESDIQ